MRSLVAMLLLLAACAAPAPVDEGLHHGAWRAWLDSPGGELPFGLVLEETDGELAATLVNGGERLPVTSAALDGDELTLFIEHYDSTVVARVGEGGRRLDGRWEKFGAGGEPTGLDFHAEAGGAARFAPGPEPASEATRALVDGRWAVDFEKSDETALGAFEVDADGTVRGTVATTTGDYRFLAGRLDADRLRLSVFDGAHAFLFDARLDEDGTLTGDFWSRDSYHERWSATKDPEFALPDAFELTEWVEGMALGEFRYPDLAGNERSLDDPAFAGNARILEVFGSWCPNCNDAAAHLVELDRKYGAQGLSIVGLAFEFSGEHERDAEQLRRYARHHDIEFPLLIAGVSDKAEASRAFPLLDRIRSYPTTIFLHGDGRVRAIHQGFSGPATGEAHDRLRERFDTLIRELLAE
jgi:thiol-disulfide isomerase/thioredoxin